MSKKSTKIRRVIGVVRVSKRNGREGESFVSPRDQRSRMEAVCERESLRLVEVFEEIDTSGATPLDKRQGLRIAVEAVEAGRADVVMTGYLDRLCRSLTVQTEVVQRVEAAGGEVYAVDFGAVSHKSAVKKMSGQMLGVINEFYVDMAREKSAEALADAVERGVFPGVVPAALHRDKHKRLVPDAQLAPVVREAFERRAGDHGPAAQRLLAIRNFLAEHGIERSVAGVRSMLRNPLYIGEIVFGDLRNDHAHEAIVPRELFERVQRVRVPRGPQAKSERLLARLGVLRCGTCGSRMSVSSAQGGQYPTYRCFDAVACSRRATISAEKVEAIVVAAVREVLADAEGHAMAADNAVAAQRELIAAQTRLDQGVHTFTEAGLLGEPSTAAALADLRAKRDQARERADSFDGVVQSVDLSAGRDWDELSTDERRDLIRATVERVEVMSGRGPDRVRVVVAGAQHRSTRAAAGASAAA